MSQSRLYPANPLLAASVAVFRGSQVLLGCRRGPPASNIYSLPGGKVEVGETLEAAALRELREETGVEAEIVGFIGFREWIELDEEGRTRNHFVIASFAARWLANDGEDSDELGPLIWTTIDDAANFELTKGLMPILKNAHLILEAAACA